MKCNGGAPMSLSQVRDALYLRPLILGLFASISDMGAAQRALPLDAPFALGARLGRTRGREPARWNAALDA
jgi:hypothetical protein